MCSHDYQAFSYASGFEGYLCSTLNGVVRMLPSTDAKVKGLSTYSIKTCLGLILQNSEGKTSLAHVISKRTDVADFIANELRWIGGPGSGVKATIVRNASFLSQPKHMTYNMNVMSVLNEIVQLLSEYEVSSSVVDTDNGAIAINRDDSSIFVPEYVSPNPSNPECIIGTLCPYGLMRTMIHQMPSTGSCSMDIQYDGSEWTIAKSIEHYGILFSAEQLRPYQNLEVSAVIKKLHKEKAIEHMRSAPGNCLDDREYEDCLASYGLAVQQYLLVKKQYVNAKFTYRMFTMTDTQRDLITSIDGEVQPSMYRGMHVFCAPTLHLTANVRKLLLIDRIGFSHKDPNTVFTRRELSGIKGWRAEPDMNKNDFYLVTFPYNDESERLRIREVLKLVLAKK